MRESFSVKLLNAWKLNHSMVCVGLDSDLKKIPQFLLQRPFPLFEFNKSIIDSTADSVCAYKPQIAYYAAYGAEEQLLMTIQYIHQHYPGILVILDAKRNDIGDTSKLYAYEAFERYNADAVTVNPYLGTDSLEPFLSYDDRGVIILCKTSNPGSHQFQNLEVSGKKVYEIVAHTVANQWNTRGNCMIVTGATYPEEIKHLRTLAPEVPFLVPGVGSQGGDVAAVVRNGCMKNGMGLIINSSRAILYANNDESFAEAARLKTIELKTQITTSIKAEIR